MILTKMELIKIACGNLPNIRPVRKCHRKIMRMQEHDFIILMKKDLNFILEPIRKNTYIIH